MNIWKDCKKEKITDLLTFIVDNRGKTVPTSTSGYKLIATNCINNESLYPLYTKIRFLSQETYDSFFRAHPKPGDIIFVCKGTPGKVCLVPDPIDFCIAQDMIALRSDQSKVDNHYLLAVLRSAPIQKQIYNTSVGDVIPHFKKQFMDTILIPIPSMEYQKKIGSLYFTLSNKIELNNQINKQLEEMAQAIFKSWFIDFEPFKDGEFVDSELGRIPKGWSVGTLEHLVEVKYGKDHKKLKAGCYPVYGSGGYMRSVDQHLYEGESVLIPRKGTLNNIMYVNESFWTVDTMFYTKPKVDSVLKYVHQHLMLIDFERMNEGTSIPSTTTATLNGLKIIIPSRSILKEYDDVLASIYNKIKQNKAENTHLSSLRDTLLPKLMSGEINLEQYGNQ